MNDPVNLKKREPRAGVAEPCLGLVVQEARLALVSGGRDVTEVAHAVGYDSASQFSREYRRFFGTPPGRHAQRIRAAGGVPVP